VPLYRHNRQSRIARVGLAMTAALIGSASFVQAQTPVARGAAPRTAAEPRPETPTEGRGGWRTACVIDIKQFCRGSSGGSAKRRCLDAAAAKLSAPCKTAMADRRQVRAETRKACAVEIGSLCGDVKGGGAKLKCLQTKAVVPGAAVGAPCGKGLAKLAASGSDIKKGK
jgi:hypothetical protein